MKTTYHYKPCPLVKRLLGQDYTCAPDLEGHQHCQFFKECPEQLIEDLVIKHSMIISQKVTLKLASMMKGALK